MTGEAAFQRGQFWHTKYSRLQGNRPRYVVHISIDPPTAMQDWRKLRALVASGSHVQFDV